MKIGDVFGKWVVVDGPFHEPHGKRKRWHCICECFSEALVNDYDLRVGKSTGCRSCGSSRAWCNSDTSRLRKYPNVSQEVYEKITGAVDNAIARCTESSHGRYHDWGWRCIKVMFADRDTFIEYLFKLPGYDDLSLVLDRIDNDGNYDIGNLQFVTRSESQRNRRNQFDGEPYYMRHGFARCFKRLHDRGVPFKEIGDLYCANPATVRNCVRELEGTR